MKKKRYLIAALCIVLSLLSLLGLLFAVWLAAKHADNLPLGGLVGELLERQSDALLVPETSDPAVSEPFEKLPTIDEQTSQELSTTPPEPEGSPTLRFFLGGCESWIESEHEHKKIQEFFEPGNALEWDHRAVIEDHNVNYVEIWGWAALFEEVPLQLGYKIDGGQSIYDDSAELYNAHESSVTAALGMGAVSATGMRVKVPVEHLVGTHTVEIVVRRLGGEEGVICTFEIEKSATNEST